MTTNQPPSRETRWRTSSYSGTAGNCIEVAELDPGIRAVRNSKDPTGPILMCTTDQWCTFTTRVRTGWLSEGTS